MAKIIKSIELVIRKNVADGTLLINISSLVGTGDDPDLVRGGRGLVDERGAPSIVIDPALSLNEILAAIETKAKTEEGIV